MPSTSTWWPSVVGSTNAPFEPGAPKPPKAAGPRQAPRIHLLIRSHYNARCPGFASVFWTLTRAEEDRYGRNQTQTLPGDEGSHPRARPELVEGLAQQKGERGTGLYGFGQ